MRPRKWTLHQLKQHALLARSYRDLLLRLGLRPAGGNYSHIKKRLQFHNLKLVVYKGQGWNKGLHGVGKPRRSLASILKRDSNYQSFKLKKRLFTAGVKKQRC